MIRSPLFRSGFAMDDSSLLFALNRRLSISARHLSDRLIHGLAVLVLAGGSVSVWAQEDPVAGFCNLVVEGGSGGAGCAALEVASDGTSRVSYDPVGSPWRLGAGPTADSGQALFSAAVGSDESSCLRLQLREGRQLLALNFDYTVSAGTSNGALTISLERDGEAAEEILRESGELAWTSRKHTVDFSQSRVVGIAICYEKGSGIGAGQDRAGVDNIQLETADPLVEFCDLAMAGGSRGSSCAALAEDEGSGARVSYEPPASLWRLGDGPTADSGQALFSAAVGSDESSCLRLRLREGRQLLALNFDYTVAAGTSTGALTISLERDGEVDDEILRESGEVAWTSRKYTVDFSQSRVVGISICYEKGSRIGAGQDRAGVDNIQLETADSLGEFCDLVIAGGSRGSGCAELSQDEGSGAKVRYEPPEIPWRVGDGDSGLALFSGVGGSDQSSCMRLQLRQGRQLLDLSLDYMVRAGTSNNALTIALHRDGAADEEVLRESGELGWTSIELRTATPGRLPVAGFSICYEKGAGSGDAGLDLAGVDDILLSTAATVDPLLEFCDLAIRGGRGGSSCAALAEDEGSGARVRYDPPASPWRAGFGQFGSALFSGLGGSDQSSCLRLQLSEGRQLLGLDFAYTVSAGNSTGALTIALHRDGAADEEVLRQSGELGWTSTVLRTATPGRLPVAGVSICYEKAAGGGDVGMDLAGVDNISLDTADPLVEFCDLAVDGGSNGRSCGALAEIGQDGERAEFQPADRPWLVGNRPRPGGLALFSSTIGPNESSCVQLQLLLDLGFSRQLGALNMEYTVSPGASDGTLVVVLQRPGEADEEPLRVSGERPWTGLQYLVNPDRAPVSGIAICYKKGATGEGLGLDWAGVDNIRLLTADPLVDFCALAMQDGSGGSSCVALAVASDGTSRVSYEPPDAPWRAGFGQFGSGRALLSGSIGSGQSSCLRLQLREGRQLAALSLGYTVRGGTSNHALTIAWSRDGEEDEEILRQSGELDWTEMLLSTAAPGRLPVTGVSICYDKGSDSGDAGLDLAGVGDIRLDTVAMADPLAEFCDLVMDGGKDGSSCAVLALASDGTSRVSYSPPENPWRAGSGLLGSDRVLFSGSVGSGASSCLRLQLREGQQQLYAMSLAYTVSAGSSSGALTIALHRDGEADEQILRQSGELSWTEMLLQAATPGRLPVRGVSICYEKGADNGDAGLDRAGVDNIRLDTADPRADFCDLAVAGGSCGALDVVAGSRVAYTPQQSPWVLGPDASGSGLALFSADVGSGDSSCLQLRFPEEHAVTELSLDYRVSSEDSGGMLTIELQRDGEEENELILRRGSPESEWAELRHVVDLDRARVSGLLACYQQGAMAGSTSDRAGLDELSFVYEYAHNRDEFCNLVIEGGSAGENCKWLRAVHSRSVDRLWEAGTSFWAAPRPLGFSRKSSCLRLLVRPRLDLSVLTGLSFNFRTFGQGDFSEFFIQRVGQQNTERLSQQNTEMPSVNLMPFFPVSPRGITVDAYTSGLDLPRGLISNFIVCYTAGRRLPDSGSPFELNTMQLQNEVIAVSKLRSTLIPRLFHIAQRPQSVDFVVQAFSQLGTMIDTAAQTTLTVRSGIAGMRLSLSVPDTGQSASGDGEVSLPLSFIGEQNVVLEFNIPPAMANETTLAVTVSGDAGAEGERRELRLFDFCGLAVPGGRDDEGDTTLRSCRNFARVVSALRFDPPDKPWRVGEGPTEDSGRALFSAELGAGERSCLRLQLNENQRLLAANYWHTVAAGSSTGALTIALERDGEPAEEILRESGEVAWVSNRHAADLGQSRVAGISICYEKGSGIDAGLDLAGLDNIRLETADPQAGFCDLAMAGGNIGASCAALAVEDEDSGARVRYNPASPWRLGEGPPEEDFGQALFSAELDSGASSCLRLRLREERRLLSANFWYTVNAGNSTGTLTITLERDGQLAEEVLRDSGEVAWASLEYPVAISQPRVAGISICYEGGSSGGDAGLDRAGVDNIRLDTAAPRADFCDLAVADGSCEALDVVAGTRVAYTPQQSPWVLGPDASGSGLALFSADVGSGESSCLQLRFPEQHALTELSLNYRVPSEDSGGQLTIRLQRDGEESEFILRRSSPEAEWAEFRQAVNLDRGRVSGLLACYQQGAIPDSASDRAGLDNLSFVYEYVHNRDEFCSLVIEGDSAGEGCEWIREVHSRSVDRVWEAGASFWAAPRPRLGFGRERSCLRLLLQPRLDSSVLTGLSFNFLAFGGGDAVDFFIQRVGQQNTEKPSVNTRSLVPAGARGFTFEVFTADLDLPRGLISNLFVCYTSGRTIPNSGALFELNAIQFEDEVIAVSMLRSRLPPRLFYIAQQPQSGTFAVQALNQLGTVVDVAIQTTLTVRSDIAGMPLSLSVPDTGQSASGEGEVSLPLRFSGEQNVMLEFDIPPATADGTTLAVTVSGDAAVAGDSRELALFDFCGLMVQGGRDDEGGTGLQQSCSDFAQSVSALRFAPRDKPWRVGEGPTADSGQALFSAELGAGERSCLRLRLREERQQLLAFNFAYTVRAGMSNHALTIALERDGEADEEVLRASGEVAWISSRHEADFGQSRVVGISICYEQGADSGDAGLDWAGLDNIRLETAAPRAGFCDLVVAGGNIGASCAALAEAAESTARVSYEPAGSPWRLGAGPPEEDFGQALFSAAVGSGKSSCLRLRLNEDRRLLAANFWYTVNAGDSTGTLTIVLERDGQLLEEVLRESGEVAWASTEYPVAINQPRVAGIAICYEGGSGGGDAGLDRAGVDNIRLYTAALQPDFCDVAVADGSCEALDEVAGARVAYTPQQSPWVLGHDAAGSGLALFSADVGSGESSCLQLRFPEEHALTELSLDYRVPSEDSGGQLTIRLQRDGEESEFILRRSSPEPEWAEFRDVVNLDRARVSGLLACYQQGTIPDSALDRAGLDELSFVYEYAHNRDEFCSLVIEGGSAGENCEWIRAVHSRSVDRVWEAGASFWAAPRPGFGRERNCLRLLLQPRLDSSVLTGLSFNFLAFGGGDIVEFLIQRDGQQNTEKPSVHLRSRVPAGARGTTFEVFTAGLDLPRGPISNLFVCYTPGRTIPDSGALFELNAIQFEDEVIAVSRLRSRLPPRLFYITQQPQSGIFAIQALNQLDTVIDVAVQTTLTVRSGIAGMRLSLSVPDTGQSASAEGEVSLPLRFSGEQNVVLEFDIPLATADGTTLGMTVSGNAAVAGDSRELVLYNFCGLAVQGGRDGEGGPEFQQSCSDFARSVSFLRFDPRDKPWRVGEGPTADSAQALFSAELGAGDSSCLYLELGEGQQLLAFNFAYTVRAGTSSNALTIVLHRDGEADEEILRRSGELDWTEMQLPTITPDRPPVAGLSICYEKGAGSGDAGLDWAGVDNIRLDTADPRADFCDVAVAGDSCEALDVVGGARVAYTPQQSPWVLGGDAAGSGLALFSADVGAGESSCMQLRFPEQHAVTELSLDYRVPSADTGGMLTIRLQRDGEENEFILRRSSPESEWAEFRHTADLGRARVSGLLACYRQGAIPGSPSDRAGLDELSFVYEYAHNRDEFCRRVIEGGSAGEDCQWIRAVHSRSVDRVWEAGASSWAAPRPGSSRARNCLRLLLQPRLDSSLLTGLSFNYLAFGGGNSVDFFIQRVGQQNTEELSVIIGSARLSGARGITFQTLTSDLDFSRGFISNLFVCYTPGSQIPGSGALFELNALQFEDEVIAVSRLRSTLPPRLFQFAQRPQSADFAVQALDQLGVIIDSTVQTTLTVRSDVAGMRLSLTVPETGQSVSGEGEVSLPLRFSGEQDVVLEFDIPLAVADGTTLAVTISAEEDSIVGESRELALFDFCGLAVYGGRDDEGEADLQQSCSDFARSVSALRFDPSDKPWRLGEGPTADSGQALFSAELGVGDSSCLRLQLGEGRQLLAFNFAYTVRAGTSNNALTIALHRDGEAAEEIMRESGEVAWTSRKYTVAPSQSRVVGISICYEKGADSGDAGLDWAGVDNIRVETASPLVDFCDLVMAGGSGGSSCAALAEDEDSGARVSYSPEESPWRLGEGQTEDSGQALFSAAVGSGESSCLRLRLGEERQLLAFNFAYTVSAGTSSGALTIALERDGGLDSEEILRVSGDVAWTTRAYTVALSQSRVVGISICYEKGSGIAAGLDRAGVDNIRLETADPRADFCDLAVAEGCGALAVVGGSRVAYTPQQSPWVLGVDASGSGLALLSADVGSGGSSCLQLRFRHALTELSLNYRVPSEDSGGMLTIRLQRDGEESEFILRRSSPEPEWAEFRDVVNRDRARVSGLLACYQQGTMVGLEPDQAGLDELRFVYEYAYDRNEFCDLAVEGGSAGENCKWIRGVQSNSVDELWGDSASLSGKLLNPSSWAVSELFRQGSSCLRLLLQPRLDSSVLTGLSFNFHTFGGGDSYEFRIRRRGQQDSERLIQHIGQSLAPPLIDQTYTAPDLDLARGLVSSFIVCYGVGGSFPSSGDQVQLELNAIQFEEEVIAVSRLRSTLPPRLFHFAQRPQSAGFLVQALNQLGIVIDAAVQTTLTVRSGVAGMRLSLSVPETGQSASGEGEVSLPLRFSGEQDVVLEFDIPLAAADGTTLAVTVSAEEDSIAGESLELRLFDFCGLVVDGGRDDEGDVDLQQSCSDFVGSVSVLRFDPPDKPWRLGDGPAEDSGRALFSAELGVGDSSCLRMQLREGRQLLAFSFAYTVRAGTSGNALTIALHRDGEADEEILRQSGELDWTEMLLPTITPDRPPVAGISICYEKGAGSGDAGLDWAGVDNIRLETASPLVDACDLVMAGGSGGSSCAALAEAAESSARVSYSPLESPWRLGEGPTEDSGQALFSAELGSGESSCLRLRLGEERQLLAFNFAYTVSAGTSSGALTVALERDGELDSEEILRVSGEVPWTTRAYTVVLSQPRVVGISICYEKGSGIAAGLDRAGVDNIRLDTVDLVAEFCDLVMAGGSGGSSCAALAEDEDSGARVSYDQSPWRLGEGPTADSGMALFSAAVGSGESSCLRLQLGEGQQQLLAVNFAYTVRAGTSSNALTIALHRDGEADEEILRESGEQDWTEIQLPTATLGRSPVAGISICYEKGADSGDAGLDWAGVDNIRLDTVDPLVDFCDLAIRGGSSGRSCAALAEAAESTAGVSFSPLESPWRAGLGRFNTALFSAAVGSGDSSCLRLRLRKGRQLLALDLDYTVRAGTSAGALTIALHRDGEEDEEILRRSGELGWTKFSRGTTTPGRRPVVGLSLCYEKDANGSAAGLDLAGVADIVLDTEDPLVAFCNIYAEGSCDALVEIGEGGEKVEFQPAGRPWLVSGGRGSRLGLYSPVIGPDERSCLQLLLNQESSRRLWALNMDYAVSPGASSGALVIVLQRQGEAPEEILRASGDQPWTALQHATNPDRGRVSGIAICYEKGAIGGDAGMDWAGIASIRLLTADPVVDFCDVAVVGGAGGKDCAVLGETSSNVVTYSPSADSWVPGDDGSGSDLALFSRAVPPGESACLQLRFPEERHVLVEVSLDYRLLSVENGGMLTIELQHDGGAKELILDRSSPEPEWTGFRREVLTQSRVSGLLVCYQQGTMAGLEPGRAGLDNLSFSYWYVHDPDRFCDLAVEGGSAGENCRWIQTVYSTPGHLPWGSYEEQRVSSSSRSLKPQAWVSSRLASLDTNCAVLILQPRLDGMILNGLSLALHSVGAISGRGIAFRRPGQFASFVSLENPIHDGGVGEIQMLRFLPSDIDPARGLITDVRMCNFLLRGSLATLAINALEFQGYLPVLSRVESTLSPRLFHIARQSQSVNFTLQTLDQMGVIIDSTARTTLTVRSGVAGMRLSLSVPGTGQSASGEGEVSLPLRFSGEQNVVLGFNIPLALADGTTLAGDGQRRGGSYRWGQSRAGAIRFLWADGTRGT